MTGRREIIQTAALVFLFTFAVLTIASAPLLGPFIFGDETVYSLTTQEGWNLPTRFSDSVIPNYVYYAIYHVAFLGSQANSLVLARILNGLFLSATAALFFVMLRTSLRSGEAFVISTALTLIYFGVFSVYFMAESLFFFWFWLIVYFYYFVDSPSMLVKAPIMGALTAMLALTKPHGLVVAAVWTVLLVLDPASPVLANLRRRLAGAALFLAAFVCSWVLMTWVITGAIPLDPVGPFYGGFVTPRITPGTIVSIAKVALRHAGYLAFFCGFPLFAAAAAYRYGDRQGSPLFVRILLAGLLFSLLQVGMTAKLTVDIDGMGPYESITRSHMRFYFASLPLLVIPFLLSVKTYLHERRRGERWLCALFFVLYTLGVLAIWANRHGAYWVDAPLLIFAGNRFALYVSVAAGALAFGLAAAGQKRSAVGAWVFFFLFSGLSSYYLDLKYLWTHDPGRLPRIAALIRECLPGKTVGRDVVFVRENLDVNPFILQYHLGAKVEWLPVTDGRPALDCDRLARYEIVVTFGKVDLGCDFDPLAVDGDTRVFRSRGGSRASQAEADAKYEGLLYKMDCLPDKSPNAKPALK